MARQEDVVFMPKTDPRLEKLLVKLPDNWMSFTRKQLEPIVAEIFGEDSCGLADLEEAMKLLGYHRVAQASYQIRKKAKDHEIRIRNMPPDHRRF